MIVELKFEEALLVAGGSIIDEIEERHPGGEWCGNSFFPNGLPRGWECGDFH